MKPWPYQWSLLLPPESTTAQYQMHDLRVLEKKILIAFCVFMVFIQKQD